jgi:hypothetical protein
LPELDFQAKEVEVPASNPVQPVERSPVLVGKSRGDPDDGGSVEASGVGHELTEMHVVGDFQLILDQHIVAGGRFATDDVRAKRTYPLLSALNLKIEAYRLAEQGYVLGLREPRRELRRLAQPVLANGHALKAAQCGSYHHVSDPRRFSGSGGGRNCRT